MPGAFLGFSRTIPIFAKNAIVLDFIGSMSFSRNIVDREEGQRETNIDTTSLAGGIQLGYIGNYFVFINYHLGQTYQSLSGNADRSGSQMNSMNEWNLSVGRDRFSVFLRGEKIFNVRNVLDDASDLRGTALGVEYRF